MTDLREVMRKWVTGVSIVTAEHAGHKHGMTVSSLASISLDPPLVTVTLANTTRTHKLVIEAGYFGVTILSTDQEWLSDRFAGKIPEELDRFASVEIKHLHNNIPVILGGLAHLACQVVHQYPMPASTLFIGEVLSAELGASRPPLVYANRAYKRLEE
jgi:flavin reductase (DIM6/NTAB) family NADH-FMN oxidoreductase RutF